jgi:hypothetical protein
MANPVIVTITWPGDPNASTWEALGDAIGGSSYWSATTAEYGVGKASSGAGHHVRMTEPLPAKLSYSLVDSLISAAVLAGESDAGAPGEGGAPNPPWPKPAMSSTGHYETIYSLFIPPSTIVTDPGTGTSFCGLGGLGYHGNPTTGIPITYAIILQCQTNDLIDTEETAVHEYVEAATNPTQHGYVGLDPGHLAWDLYAGLQGSELADECQDWQDSYFLDTGAFPYWVQSSWSNKAALLGHDPCVPSPSTPYYGLTLLPSTPESPVTVDLAQVFGGSGKVKTLGFPVTIGKPLTFEVGFFSDAPRAPWTIAYDFSTTNRLTMTSSYMPVGNGSGTVTIDKATGQNGDKATVTVTTKTKGELGFHLIALTWDPPTKPMFYAPHYLPIVLVDQ